MTRKNIALTQVTFISHFAISQSLWKSAGKLVDTLLKNKEILHDKFKHYIKGKDYSKSIKIVVDEFMQPFEIFGKSLERDINMFFSEPYKVLTVTLSEAYEEIEESKDLLSDMRKNPELYRNPITLFEIKLRQHEWMNCNTGTVRLSQF
ncbi:tetratricopeptide repeat family protein [Gracilibacillus boraciitolerans JCM 21714]|uniref:Tetratricopeptide repeat family protein n=1 Tax=Gracilibacillus boraciitolerans JCM 21714 TaxID=1298598 RepID=W4VHI1_9BACI|nr:hypothetical protein [Gracilibacillus boraciitolerans]GAE92278.1 tetratricopeptide repeat family protein [Gracilibacillus boraciitolerans JCM 21714]